MKWLQQLCSLLLQPSLYYSSLYYSSYIIHLYIYSSLYIIHLYIYSSLYIHLYFRSISTVCALAPIKSILSHIDS